MVQVWLERREHLDVLCGYSRPVRLSPACGDTAGCQGDTLLGTSHAGWVKKKPTKSGESLLHVHGREMFRRDFNFQQDSSRNSIGNISSGTLLVGFEEIVATVRGPIHAFYIEYGG